MNRDNPTTELRLSACPFCGSDTAPRLSCEDLVHHPDCQCYDWQMAFPVVICAASAGGCGASSGSDENGAKVIARWNRRVL
jgi:hypothetical protein